MLIQFEIVNKNGDFLGKSEIQIPSVNHNDAKVKVPRKIITKMTADTILDEMKLDTTLFKVMDVQVGVEQTDESLAAIRQFGPDKDGTYQT